MKKESRSSIEIVTDLFTSAAFKTARHQYPHIDNDEDLLPYVLELLLLANRQFNETIKAYGSQSDAIYDVMVMFRILCPKSV